MHVLRALQHQQLCRCSIAALPSCTSWVSTSSSLLQQNPQLMRVKQPEGQHSTDQQQRTSPWTYLAAGGAAAAAGWAAWTYNNSSSTSAAPIDPMRLAHAPPRAQAAVGAACAGPLLHLQHALNPTPAQLQGIAAALEADSASLGPELVTGLWGLAMFGPVLPQQQLARLAGAVIEQIPQLPVYEAIVAAWAVTLLSSSSSNSSNSSSSSSSSLSSAAWQSLLQRLQSAHHRELKDEAALLYLLHAAMQQAATAAAGTRRGPHQPASAAGGDGASSSSNSSSSSSSTGGDGEGAGYRAAAMDQPHATLQEVLQTVAPLHDKIKKWLSAAYQMAAMLSMCVQEYVPFQPYVEGPLLVVLHVAKTLPRYISAAAAAAGPAGSSGPSPLAAVFGGLSGADALAASEAIADPARLGKLKRDLYFRWRADELLDRHQQAVNQVAHVLYRRMQLPIKQGTDADVVLPSLKAAVFVVDDSQPGACQSSTSGITSSTLAGPPWAIGGSPPSPFTAAFWTEAHVGLQQLMRNRYSAPQGGFACRECEGIANAKAHCLQQRGWTVVVLKQSEVEGALGGFKAGRVRVNDSYNYKGLDRMLRNRLEL